MAINPESQYPGKIAPSSADYPYGAARNITTPGDGTGTPWEAALVNDIFGFQQQLLSETGAVPTGSPEKVGASQYYDAISSMIAGGLAESTSTGEIFPKNPRKSAEVGDEIPGTATIIRIDGRLFNQHPRIGGEITAIDLDDWEVTVLGGQTLRLYPVDRPANPSLGVMLEHIANNEAVKIVCIGDSVTWGSDGDNPGVQVPTPYPDALKAILDKFYVGNAATVVNAGRSGSDTKQYLANYFAGDVVAENPDVIVLMHGVNDARGDRGIDPQQYVNNLMEMCRLVPDAAVVFASPTMISKAQNDAITRPKFVDFYRQSMRLLADKLGYEYANMYDRMLSILNQRDSGRGKLNGDGLHWSNEAYGFIAGAIFTESFANQTLDLKVDQFRAATGTWLAGSSLTWTAPNTDDGVNVNIGSEARLFVYAFGPSQMSLVLHSSFGNNSADNTSRAVTVQNETSQAAAVTYDLAITVTGTTYFVNGHPFVTCPIRPGLNIIRLSTVGYFDFSGFSLVENAERGYQTYFNDGELDGETAWGVNNYMIDGIREIAERSPVVASVTDSVSPIGVLVPRSDGVASKWRLRGFFQQRSAILLGQQQQPDGAFKRTWDIVFNPTQIVVRAFNSNDTAIVLLTDVNITTAATGSMHKLDIVTDNTGWSLYCDDLLIFTETIPLGVAPVAIRTPDSTGVAGPCVAGPLWAKGRTESDTGAIRGERWTDWGTNEIYVTGVDSVDRKAVLT